jgi:hypothetical protein
MKILIKIIFIFLLIGKSSAQIYRAENSNAEVHGKADAGD